MRRTKIVATVGPATSSPDALRALLGAGADVVRLNAAHGAAAIQGERAPLARATAARIGRVVGVLVDLPGPKLRSGPLAGDEVELVAGHVFTLTASSINGGACRA